MALKTAVGVLLLLLSACTTPGVSTQRGTTPTPGISFIENDWKKALQAGRERNIPVFVDVWAPWCQSCRSMRATVMPSPELLPLADRFIWLAINTEVDTNAAFLERYPIDTWPTLFVLEPEQGEVVSRSLGAVSVQQLIRYLDHSEQAFRQGREDLAQADALALAGRHEDAATAYQRLLETLPREDARRPGTTVSLIKSLAATGRALDCVRQTAKELPALSRVEDRSRLLYVGLGCALDIETEEARTLRSALEQEALRALDTPEGTLTSPQRSSLYEVVCEVREVTGDEPGMKKLAETWWRFLEAEAARAKDSEERAALDAHREMAAALMDRPEVAIPALERSEQEFPEDPGPPSRLASLYLMAGQKDLALAASERALARVKGPSRTQVLVGHARVLRARGERAQAEQLLTQALRELGPDSTRSQRHRRILEFTLTQLREDNTPTP
ncbi:hypothetical protein MYSTI_06785 [Myxococcus stipitatus DSM 14675]|uniref:Thioredoxin domain-containing protein n=1 Tax=Myxococcus stipitatus (strain DSM 14675 / JCM 12634 / Mx s8) TaxID=1278073 RepID=L7UJ64_MYXSD|nr:thioredoxin family protein [Myxococcus stipitatus]AGC48058.1 hypothetical protein MYSTI_06785 [Myxococcus stipitatus DSM 14675]